MSLKIIYIDDEVDLLELFKDHFEENGIEIECFSNPEIGLKKVQSQTPDLVFIDYRLPGTTGDELALKIKNDVPKILITGEIEISPKANFLKIFPKPYDSDEILNFIRSFQKKAA